MSRWTAASGIRNIPEKVKGITDMKTNNNTIAIISGNKKTFDYNELKFAGFNWFNIYTYINSDNTGFGSAMNRSGFDVVENTISYACR